MCEVIAVNLAEVEMWKEISLLICGTVILALTMFLLYKWKSRKSNHEKQI